MHIEVRLLLFYIQQHQKSSLHLLTCQHTTINIKLYKDLSSIGYAVAKYVFVLFSKGGFP